MLTGHRPKYLTPSETAWSKKELYRTAARLQRFHGTTTLISGLALGADLWWAEAARKLGLMLETFIPFEGQAFSWAPEDREKWKSLRNYAAQEHLYGQHYDVRLFHARDAGMVDAAEFCVALLKTSVTSGGTFATVAKIRKSKKPLLVLDPESRTIVKENWIDN